MSPKTRRHNDDGEPILNYEKKKVSMKTRLPSRVCGCR